jgi:hypothetical protein
MCFPLGLLSFEAAGHRSSGGYVSVAQQLDVAAAVDCGAVCDAHGADELHIP